MNSKKASLICLPFAGAGASFFNEWSPAADPLDIVAVQLPGREKRFTEPLYTDVNVAADGIVTEVQDEIPNDIPLVIFGHSLGAVLAYELAHRLTELGMQDRIAALVVSGSPDPWTQRSKRATGLSDNEFVARVNEFSGFSHPALEDDMMRELLLPSLRADVAMHENYAPRSDKPLDINVITVRGSEDELVSAEHVRDWHRASTLSVRHEELTGGHMYFTGDPKPLLSLLRNVAL